MSNVFGIKKKKIGLSTEEKILDVSTQTYQFIDRRFGELGLLSEGADHLHVIVNLIAIKFAFLGAGGSNITAGEFVKRITDDSMSLMGRVMEIYNNRENDETNNK